jgi:hypothetical protein
LSVRIPYAKQLPKNIRVRDYVLHICDIDAVK